MSKIKCFIPKTNEKKTCVFISAIHYTPARGILGSGWWCAQQPCPCRLDTDVGMCCVCTWSKSMKEMLPAINVGEQRDTSIYCKTSVFSEE